MSQKEDVRHFKSQQGLFIWYDCILRYLPGKLFGASCTADKECPFSAVCFGSVCACTVDNYQNGTHCLPSRSL